MRLADARDFPALDRALDKLTEFAASYKWVGNVNQDKGRSYLRNCIRSGNGYIVDGYLVMVDEVQPWYTDDRTLEEWLVIKLYPGGSVDSVPPALLEIGAKRGCWQVVAADSSPVNIMADAYVRAGFSPLTQSLVKEIPKWGTQSNPPSAS